MALKNPAQGSALISPRTIEFLTKSWSYIFLLGIVIFFSVTGTGFFSVRNFSSVLTTSTLIMLMAIGQTYVIITAGIDLSIGWTVGLSSVTTARVMRDLAESGNDIAFAMLMGVFAGLLVALIPGLVNGVLVARIKVPPFIATLGMFGIVRGAAFLLTDGQQVVRGLSSELREALRGIGKWQPALLPAGQRLPLVYEAARPGATAVAPPANILCLTPSSLQRWSSSSSLLSWRRQNLAGTPMSSAAVKKPPCVPVSMSTAT